VKLHNEFALLRFRGIWVVVSEMWSQFVEKQKITLGHMLVKVAFHHAGIDQVFKELSSRLKIEFNGGNDKVGEYCK